MLPPLNPAPKNMTFETVQDVTHYTDRLFSFRLTRPQTFRFRSGEFVMIGLEVEGKPLLRAYSIASPAWDDGLDFFSIKVPDGPLTSRLQTIQSGDKLLLGKKPTGTLVLDALLPGKRLFLFSTGTGVAPFTAVIRDPETYEIFDQVILTQTCRILPELGYAHSVINAIKTDPMVSEIVGDKLVFYDSLTRETYRHQGRITDLMRSGQFFKDLALSPLNPETDRVMICGGTPMLKEMAALCEDHGLKEGANTTPAAYVIEKAFVG